MTCPKLGLLRMLTLKYVLNGKILRILVIHGLSSCFTLGEIFFRNDEGNPHTHRLHVSDYIYITLTLCNYWVFFLALSFTFYGLSAITCTLINHYFSNKILHHAWTSIVEVHMTIWMAINILR